MTKYVVYQKQQAFPERVFQTKKEAVEFVGGAVSIYEVRVFKYLTKQQIVMLSLPDALAFEMTMDYAITKTQLQMEK